jgi:hypothetical protein
MRSSVILAGSISTSGVAPRAAAACAKAWPRPSEGSCCCCLRVVAVTRRVAGVDLDGRDRVPLHPPGAACGKPKGPGREWVPRIVCCPGVVPAKAPVCHYVVPS